MRTEVDAAYRQLGIAGSSAAAGSTLQDLIDGLAQVPLEFSPGTAWNYSHSTDVVGYLVEVISGQRLDRYLADHIFEPLGMTDTAFWVRPDQADRLGSTYAAAASGAGIEVVDDAATSPFLREPTFLSGGGGLVSTAGDYLRFCRMLLGNGRLDGARILGRKTLELMTQNHLPGNRSISDVVASGEYRASYAGNGFGLGFAVGAGHGGRPALRHARRVLLVWRGGHVLLDRPCRGAGRRVHDAVPDAVAGHALQPRPRAPGDRLRRAGVD